ncbi:hypothetical protein [Ktedonobacter racemifer]|uniref:hypothetical protein n=1 Tax=Ktedonobacter racemifer TaxID=363277 RepID=UPI00146A1A39|nr:hypothetical protein [Ktedonobacter racemifer]
MSELLWNVLLDQLAQSQQQASRLCVGCWYKQNTLPFPPQASSCLCPTCATETRERGLSHDVATQAYVSPLLEKPFYNL